MKSVPNDGKPLVKRPRSKASEWVLANEGPSQGYHHFRGGISTLEVEAVLLSHPKVSEAAVVGQPDALLNDMPCAFVRLKEGFGVSAEDIIEFCGDQLSNHMIPKSVVFGELPVNFSEKVRKFSKRETINANTSLAN
ncbi:hypothetical protein SADUNF_Sadunf12G0018900 [Salix dunnii]|uniref:AMP-binding enzyme C-terminal domain-containing protein n=1 Tax=Salix dunnii TaxID=1413687 RepID=A0A835JMB1_9ROSI|nr:hypothetical protein SADUNF_Sadunf12G0018900 [Salix dunnii]